MFEKRPLMRWAMAHVGIVLLLLFYPLYVRLAQTLFPSFSGCILHDYLFVYCPMCGGTRALTAMLHLQFAKAFSYNPLVVVGVFFALILDAVLLIRILKKKEPMITVSNGAWVALASVLILYGILRNVLMICYGYDPLGDLGPIWQILNS